MRLTRDFFARPPQVVAPELLGCEISSYVDGERVAVRLTEVEAYCGTDPASHTFRGRTPRNGVMFGEPGHLYVYFSYGMHFCANLVSHEPGESGGVLLRAGVVTDGIETARRRRGFADSRAAHHLARGPACVASCLALSTADSGRDACGADPAVEILSPTDRLPVVSGPRVGVSQAADVPWRFWIAGDRTVSSYKRSPRAPMRPPGNR